MEEFTGYNKYAEEQIPFLKSAATHLFTAFGSDLGKVCVVTPNRRAGIYIRKYLAELVTGPVWAPAVYAIEDFMAILSGMTEVEPVLLLTELYEIHRAVEQEKAGSFEDFLSWGGQLIADFNDIDRNLTDGRALFNYLDEAKALALWNPDGKPLTPFQKDYLRFYKSLGRYYEMLGSSLISRKTGYQGLVFRKAAERVATGIAEIPWESVLFTGFNVLTRAEEEVMNHLRMQGKGHFFWDADHFYLDHELREAGFFLRRWFKQWPLSKANRVSDCFKTSAKNIRIVGVPDPVGQVKLCGELLQNLGTETGEETAVILPDEKLLLPLMNSLPAELSQFNVTMGFPLKQTSLAVLLDQTCYMHLHATAMLTGTTDTRKFYYHDLISLLRNPLLARIALQVNGNGFALNDLIMRLKSGDRIFISPDHLQGMGLFGPSLEFLEPFVTPWARPDDAIRDLRRIAEWTRKEPFESESAYVMATILHRLELVVERHSSWFSLQSFSQFFKEMVNSCTLPFVGEPLQGLQIMGMLETRTLDFKNLIILSCNEGLLPTGKIAHSFIPFDIRSEYGLPTYRQKDAIYAYHFFRLLQRAENIWLLYNTEPDKLSGGEVSRYIRQVIRELPEYNPKITINQHIVSSGSVGVSEIGNIEIQKKGWVYQKILDKAAEGLSPTALNSFRKCPLQFYLSEIAGIREPEDQGDTIDARMLGTAVHHALYQLYTPLKGKTLNHADIDAMKKSADTMIRNAFEEKFKRPALNYGKNLLLVHVATRMVQNFLESEQVRLLNCRSSGATIRIEVLEQPVWRELSLMVNGKEYEVRIKGFIDRADRVGAVLRIADYKTGRVLPKDMVIGNWDELLTDPVKDKCFQLLTYTWLFPVSDSATSRSAGVVPLQLSSPKFLPVRVGIGKGTRSGENNRVLSGGQEDDGEESTVFSADEPENLSPADMETFEGTLRQLIGRLLDPSIPIGPAENPDHCKNCRYLNLCGRTAAF